MRALILVDIQNDFMPDGALPVPDGYEVVPVANKLAKRFGLVVATQDWHPEDHGSFASNNEGMSPGDVGQLAGLEQIMWPDHCVQTTAGARFVPSLDPRPIEAVVRKGTDPTIDSYSGFYDNGHRKSTGLAGYLRERGVVTVYIAGVATDYCVKWTALDARREGFEAYVVEDGCRGVEMNEGDVQSAYEEMRDAAVRVVSSNEVPD